MTNGRPNRFALPAGYKLHWYEIVSVLGQGGFGITYLARDTNLNHSVAIKEFLPTDLAARTHDSSVEPISDGHADTYGWGLKRFVTEAQTLARFRHPNIVLVYSVFEANHTAYMVMEYVGGRTLEDSLKFKKIDGEAEFKRTILAIMDGLELVHHAGFIHRDIKPENIFVRDDGTPVLLDFGSARQAIGGKTRTLTALVSPGYAPYEQYDSSRQSEGKQGPWTDIYALGATLYRAVTGHGPPDSMQRMSAVVDGKDVYQSVTAMDKDGYSGDFLRAIDWALEFKPENRPQSIDEWRKALLGELKPDAITMVGDVSKAKAGERPITAPTAADTEKVSDTDNAEASPALKLPARKPAAKPIRPAPGEDEPASKHRTWVSVVAVVIVAAMAGALYWADLIPIHEGDMAPAPEAPQAAAAGEHLSPEELARRRTEESKQRAAALEKELEAERKRAELEARRLSELEAARERQEQVAVLLAGAEGDLKEGRLVSPKENNALYRYRRVLSLDSGNAAAKAGLENTAAALVQLAGAAVSEQNFDRAADYIAEAQQIVPDSQTVLAAQRELDAAKSAYEADQRRLTEARHAEAEAERKRTSELERQARIKTTLALAEQDLKAGRLVSPEDNNALARYRAVLTLDPDNPEGKIGVEAVTSGLLTLGSEAVSQNDFDKAAEYLTQAEAIDPKSKRIVEAKLQLAKARKAHELEKTRLAEEERRKVEADKTRKVEALLSQAEDDLKVLRLTSPPEKNALRRYQQVLELDPGNTKAQSGILRIGEKYLELKDKAVAQGDFDKAKDYLDKAGQVLPGAELVVIARHEYDSARAKYEQAKAEQKATPAATQETEQPAKAQGEPEPLGEIQANAQAPPSATISSPPQKPPKPVVIKNLRTAVLPLAYRRVPGWRGNIIVEHKWNDKIILRHVGNAWGILKVTHAFGNGSLGDPVLSDEGKVWISKGFNRMEPNLDLIYERAARISVDVVVMTWLEPERNVRKWPAEYYVIDVPNRRVFHERGMAGTDGYMGRILPALARLLRKAREQKTTAASATK